MRTSYAEPGIAPFCACDLRRLGGAAKGERRRPVKSCLLICAPRVSEGSHFTRPLREMGFFHEALTASKHGIELLHPTSTSAPSFPFWVEEVGDGARLLVPDRRLQNAFQSPSRNEGLLYLERPTLSDLRLTYGGTRYHYCRLGPQDFALPDSLFFRGGGVSLKNRLLRESRLAGTELTPWQVEVATPDRPPEGWANPLLLRLDLSGDACMEPPAGALPSDTRVVFRQLMEQATLLGVIPGFEVDDDVRWTAWQQLLSLGRGPLNAVEQLVAGGSLSDAARAGSNAVWAFVALDSLGGRFSLSGHGTEARTSALEYHWHPPAKLAPNARWVATKLLESWGRGTSLVGAPPPIERRARVRRRGGGDQTPTARFADSTTPPPNGRVLDASTVIGFPGRTLAVAPRRFAPRELAAATRTVVEFVSLCADLEGSFDGGVGVIAGFFEAFFGELELNAVPFSRDRHLGWMRLIGEERLALDAAGLFNDLAKRYVTPRSPFLIRIPDPEQRGETLHFDPITCVPSGDRALMWGLLRPRVSDAQDNVRIISLTMGWWNGWHEALFNDPVDVKLRFRAAGFELGLATLGGADLGGHPSGSGGSQIMRFSVLL